MFALPARLQLLDDRLAVRSNRLSRHRGLRDLMRAVSRLGDGVAWYTLAACLYALVGAEALMALPGGAPTAIFCIADRLAVSTCAWLTRHGYRVPDDVSVACIDDPALLSFCAPSITAMSFDYQTMGTIAGKLLLGEIDKGKGAPGEVIMPYTLQERASTRAVN